MSRLASLERLARAGSAKLRQAQQLHATLEAETRRLDAEALAVRALLEADTAAPYLVDLVSRRIVSLDARKAAAEAALRRSSTRVFEEARRTRMFESARDAETVRERGRREALLLRDLIERIAHQDFADGRQAPASRVCPIPSAQACDKLRG